MYVTPLKHMLLPKMLHRECFFFPKFVSYPLCNGVCVCVGMFVFYKVTRKPMMGPCKSACWLRYISVVVFPLALRLPQCVAVVCLQCTVLQ